MRHVADVTAKAVREVIVTNASSAGAVMTVESAICPAVGRNFAGHETVNHSANEYAHLCAEPKTAPPSLTEAKTFRGPEAVKGQARLRRRAYRRALDRLWTTEESASMSDGEFRRVSLFPG